MATLDQIRANRENAQFSTGPQSESGKEISSANHTKHGLTSRKIVLKTENQAEYDELLAGLHAEYTPHSTTEVELVYEVAGQTWRLRRADSVETRLFDEAGDDVLKVTAELDKVRRYRTSIEKAWHKAIEHLRKIQASRAKPAPEPKAGSMKQFDKAMRDYLFAPAPPVFGFESQNVESPDLEGADPGGED